MKWQSSNDKFFAPFTYNSTYILLTILLTLYSNSQKRTKPETACIKRFRL